MRETWYVLEDGTPVHPSEVAPNEDGRLAHKSGLVAMRDDGETPRSRGVDVAEVVEEVDEAEQAEEAAKATEDAVTETTEPAPKVTTEAKPEPQPKKPRAKKPGYKTRKAK